MELFKAAVEHDVERATQLAPVELRQRIKEWTTEKCSKRMVGLLIKTTVLSDTTMITIPELISLNLFDPSLLDKKPSLVCMYIVLKKRYDRTVTCKAMRRAANMTDKQIAAHVGSIDTFVLQLTNKDDRKRR